jgi:hypothetical protein
LVADAVALLGAASRDPTNIFRRSPVFRITYTVTIAGAVAMMMSLSTVQAGDMKKDAMMKKETISSEMKKEPGMDDNMKKGEAMGKNEKMMGKRDDMMMKKDKMAGEKK